MLKSTLIAITASLSVFFISWGFITPITKTLGTHSAHDSTIQLKQLHYSIYPYIYDHKSLPEAEQFNKIIQDRFKKGSGDQTVKDHSHNSSLYEAAEYITKNRSLHLWGHPPVYIKDETLPEGYGFYLTGEDGISKSLGRDPDDVNSWDRYSFRFYTHREHQEKSRRIKIYSFIPAVLTFLYFMLRSRKRKSYASSTKY